ncbi:MAG: FkbM family methyltransferase [bacterium]
MTVATRYAHLAHALRREGVVNGLRTRWRRHVWTRAASIRREVEVPIQSGVRLRLFTDDAASMAIFVHDFERVERQFLNAFLRSGDILVDVGANLGLYSVIAGSRVGSRGQVYAFEPGARAFQRLVDNVALNRLTNVECHRVALSDRTGQAPMASSLDGYDAWNSLGRPIRGSRYVQELVECSRWDDFARQHGLVGRVAMMKIDVEGWERHVLLGGAETFRRDDAPVLQIEFTDEAARAAGSSCAALYGLLEDLGYQMHAYDGSSGRLKPDPLREEYPYVNLMAVKRPELVLRRLERRSAWLRSASEVLSTRERAWPR